MDLLLVNPPEIAGHISDRDKAGGLATMFPVNRRYRYRAFNPPMDLLYTAGMAQREGATVAIADLLAERIGVDGLIDRWKEAPPRHVGVRLSLPSLAEDLACAEALKAALPQSKVFLFGNVIQTTAHLWKAASHADAIFYGEPEGLVVDHLAGTDQPHVRPPSEPEAPWRLVPELDGLAYPAWHLLDLPRYSPTGRVEDMTFYLLTSRGCPKACSMCPYYVHQGAGWRWRSVQDVAGELDYLQKLGAIHLQTRDPNIGLNQKRMRELAKLLAALPRKFDLRMETDLETLDPETLRLLAIGGVKTLMTGLESADPAILTEINQKPEALERALANVDRCAKLGIQVVGFMVVGASNDSFQSVKATIRMAQALPIRYSVSLMTPYLGTEFTEQAIRQGHFTPNQDFHRYGGTACVLRTKHMRHDEVAFAYEWAKGELELTQRARDMHGAPHFSTRAYHALRYLKHLAWHAPRALRFAAMTQRSPAVAPQVAG